jgi:hypothetical protein
MSVTHGMNVLGFGHQLLAGNRIADDFLFTEGCHIDTINFYAYQTNSGNTSTITAVNVQIWDGPPGVAGSSVVWGDASTNVMIDTAWTGIYRVTETSTGQSDARPIMEQVIQVDTDLTPGSYWLDWQSDGSASSGPWAPPIACTNEANCETGDGLQSVDSGATWNPVVDSGNGAAQGFPFKIMGNCAPTGACCATCLLEPWGCSELTEAECAEYAADEDAYLGDGTVCDPYPEACRDPNAPGSPAS